MLIIIFIYKQLLIQNLSLEVNQENLESSILEQCLNNDLAIPESIVFLESLKSAYLTFASIFQASKFFSCMKGEVAVNDKIYKIEYSCLGYEKQTNIDNENEKVGNIKDKSKDFNLAYHEDWKCQGVSCC